MKLCKDVGECLEKYEAEEGKGGVYKGKGNEPQWFIKKVDYRDVKEEEMREKKQIGDWEAGWPGCLSASRLRKTSLGKQSVVEEAKVLERWKISCLL